MNSIKDLDMDDLAIIFVYFLEGRMEGILDFTREDLCNYAVDPSFPEVGEAEAPSKALLFKGRTISLISGTSGDLHAAGYEPYPDTHFNTQFALTITQALATFHAKLRLMGTTSLTEHSENSFPPSTDSELNDNCNLESCSDESLSSPIDTEKDDWTCQVTRPKIVAANLSILAANFKHIGVSSRIVDKMELLQDDIGTLTQFLQFAAMMQSNSRLQSVGPVSMCDIWIPSGSSIDMSNLGEDIIVIRLRGGSRLQAPPLRDTAWVWLTLLRPEVLKERYMELCELYCTTYNEILQRTNYIQKENDKEIDSLTLFDIMRDLGENFLHGFLTMVHKSTVSGVWALDRNLQSTEGRHLMAESIAFLVDNGIIGSLFVA